MSSLVLGENLNLLILSLSQDNVRFSPELPINLRSARAHAHVRAQGGSLSIAALPKA